MEGLWPTLIQGDCRDVLKTLESESVHCCVTSPPYWGLRDYGVAGQIGLEATPELHIEALLAVFREVWRVLRKDGTLWLNYGDCYTSGDRNGHGTRQGQKQGTNRASANGHDNVRPSQPAGLKPKDLVGMPWRLAFALQADGWWLRSDIIWSKPNPMPESVTDRPTRAHEYLFLLSKQPRYFYDADAIREPSQVAPENAWRYQYDRPRGRNKRDGDPGKPDYITGNGADWPASRNKRTVWEIATQPTPEAHFATFPEALVEPCVLAGTSECGCCPECGAPWERVVEKERRFESGSGRSGNLPVGKNGAGLQGGGETKDIRRGPCVDVQTTGWAPTCAHPHREQDVQPALVLDPFAGSGTVMRVANRLARRSIGIELSAEYVETIARKRTAQGSLGL